MTDRGNIIFSGDSEGINDLFCVLSLSFKLGSLRAWNLTTPSASTYLCGPYRRCLPIFENISDLQQMKTSMISYKQIKCQDSDLRIHVEDRSQLMTQTDSCDEQQISSIFGTGGQQRLLHVNLIN